MKKALSPGELSRVIGMAWEDRARLLMALSGQRVWVSASRFRCCAIRRVRITKQIVKRAVANRWHGENAYFGGAIYSQRARKMCCPRLLQVHFEVDCAILKALPQPEHA